MSETAQASVNAAPFEPARPEPAPGRNGFAAVFVLVVRFFAAALAVCLMAISVPLFLLPIPLGIPIFITSLILLAAASKAAHARITGFIKKHPALWNKVKRAFGE